MFSLLASAPLFLVPALVTGGVAPRHDGVHLPSHFEIVEVAGAWIRPCALVFAADGTAFIGEKPGRVLVHSIAAPQSTPFITLYDQVNSRDDRGLLGLALHPDFAPDGGSTSWVYLAYTVTPILGENPLYNQDQMYSWSVLERYRAITNGAGEIVADLASRQYLLGERLPDGTAPNAIASLRDSHSNGSLIFADDGTLMISCGEGAHFVGLDVGGQDDPAFDDFVHPVTGLRGQIPKDQDSGAFRAQDLRSLAGKVLRIDPETGLGLPSNPFHDGNDDSLRSRIWSLGLRNGYRMAFLPGTGSSDPSDADPGLFVVGDVGAQHFEELNLVDGPGLNFMWPCFEGVGPKDLYAQYNRPATNPFGFLDCGDPHVGTARQPLLAWSRSVAPSLFPPGTPCFSLAGNSTNGFTGSCAIVGDFYLGGGGYPREYEGRLFVSDYGSHWIRTIEFDAQFAVAAVHEFATGFENVVDFERHPVTGEIWVVQLRDADGTPGHLWRLRHGANATPIARLEANYVAGQAPLLVTLDASDSFDPDLDPLTFTFDPGDGSAPVVTTASTLDHTYTSNGFRQATVLVEDVGGLSASAQYDVLVGITAPLVAITSPGQGHEILTPADVLMTGSGVDLDGLGEVELVWDMTQHHNSHAHPGAGAGTGTTFLAQISDHGASGDLVYHEIALTGTTQSGASSTARLFTFDTRQIFDRTGTARFISRLDQLTPPTPLGGGNTDFEVVRDLATAPGANPLAAQFDTEHGGDQGTNDWIGFELVAPAAPYEKFVGVDFTSGVVSTAGGWFESLDVEVRVGEPCPLECGCEWQCVEHLAIEPPYPTGADAPLGSDFTTYRLRFAPIAGDAVRLRGAPGGTVGFISAAELRILTAASNPFGDARDATAEGALIARILELDPPASLGRGNPNLELVRDGTEPEPGSASEHAQFASFHNGDQGAIDYYGLAFDEPYTFVALQFREGLHHVDGGWFEDFDVQVRLRESDPWTSVAGLEVAPPLRDMGIGTLSYESFDFAFDPIVGRQIRLVGTPGGSAPFTTISELAVFVLARDPALCVIELYGEGYAGNSLALSTKTAPVLGSPVALQIDGCAGATFGWIGLSGGALDIDLGGAQHLLIDTTLPLSLYNFATDSNGLGILLLQLPASPALAGVDAHLQAVAYNPSSSLLDLSNGLRLRLCP